MEWTARRIAILVGWSGAIGAMIFLALTVYPFDYALTESALLTVGLFGGVLLWCVLDTTIPGANG